METRSATTDLRTSAKRLTLQHDVFIGGGHRLSLRQPQVMGILNTTPDSFSDGGMLGTEDGSGVFRVCVDKALQRARQMLDDGATLLDVGGESTRPGAPRISEQEELDRVIPVVEALSRELGAAVSVDSSSARVMREAAQCGAMMINDVRSLRRSQALDVVVAEQLGACIMHMPAEPEKMQINPHYEDVVAEVFDFLQRRVSECLAAGIARESLMIDPGFGFGKTLEHNYTLLRNLQHFRKIGLPLLVGVSRKSMIGAVVDRSPAQRTAGGLAAALWAVQAGASVIRTHDVAATVDALKVQAAIHGHAHGVYFQGNNNSNGHLAQD